MVIIHGKNVDFAVKEGRLNVDKGKFIFEEGKISFPKIAADDKWQFSHHAEKSNNPGIRKLFQAYLKEDDSLFFKYLVDLIKSSCIIVLNKNPKFIAADNFLIHLNFCSNTDYRRQVSYDPQRSNLANAHLFFNITPNLLPLIVGTLEESLTHEFIHHMDLEKGKRLDILSQRLEEYTSLKNAKTPRNLSLILRVFILIRIEGFASFLHSIKMFRGVKFDTYSFRKTIEILGGLCKNFDSDYIDAVDNKFHSAYDAGSMMAALIVLDELFKKGEKFDAWISPLGLLSSFKDRNAAEIKRFFGKKNFQLRFVGEDIDSKIEPIIKDLSKCNYREFLQKYENACNSLGIKKPFLRFGVRKPFFNRNSYNYYATLCIYNYKKRVLGVEDSRIRKRLFTYRA